MGGGQLCSGDATHIQIYRGSIKKNFHDWLNKSNKVIGVWILILYSIYVRSLALRHIHFYWKKDFSMPTESLLDIDQQCESWQSCQCVWGKIEKLLHPLKKSMSLLLVFAKEKKNILIFPLFLGVCNVVILAFLPFYRVYIFKSETPF